VGGIQGKKKSETKGGAKGKKVTNKLCNNGNIGTSPGGKIRTKGNQKGREKHFWTTPGTSSAAPQQPGQKAVLNYGGLKRRGEPKELKSKVVGN